MAHAPTPPVEEADRPAAPVAGDRRSETLAGAALMAAAMIIIPVMDLIAKLLGRGGADAELAAILGFGDPLPALQVAWARFAVQTAVLTPILFLAAGAAAFWPKSLGLTILRGLLIAMCTVLFFLGLEKLPLADSAAILFVAPLILTVLSAVFLKETIGWRRISAVIAGLGGAMLIIQPNFANVGLAALYPLATAVCFAVYLMLTRVLAPRENALTLHLWAGISGAASIGAALVIGTLLAAPGFQPAPANPPQIAALVFLGLVGAATHFLIVLAFRRAPASVLAPLQYLEIVSAALFGYVVFSDAPSAGVWLGVFVIVASGCLVIWREAQKGAEAQPQP